MKGRHVEGLKELINVIEKNGMIVGGVKNCDICLTESQDMEMIGTKQYALITISAVVPLLDTEKKKDPKDEKTKRGDVL